MRVSLGVSGKSLREKKGINKKRKELREKGRKEGK